MASFIAGSGRIVCGKGVQTPYLMAAIQLRPLGYCNSAEGPIEALTVASGLGKSDMRAQLGCRAIGLVGCR